MDLDALRSGVIKGTLGAAPKPQVIHESEDNPTGCPLCKSKGFALDENFVRCNGCKSLIASRFWGGSAGHVAEQVSNQPAKTRTQVLEEALKARLSTDVSESGLPEDELDRARAMLQGRRVNS